MLVPLGREKVVLYSEIVGAIVDLILNYMLIPTMGAAGAAIGTLAAEAAVWIVQFYVLREVAVEAYKKIPYTKIIGALSVGTVITYWVKRIDFGNFITLVISSMLFFGGYGLILIMTKESFVVEILKSVFKKKEIGNKI